jgi:hypothetical protein
LCNVCVFVCFNSIIIFWLKPMVYFWNSSYHLFHLALYHLPHDCSSSIASFIRTRLILGTIIVKAISLKRLHLIWLHSFFEYLMIINFHWLSYLGYLRFASALTWYHFLLSMDASKPHQLLIFNLDQSRDISIQMV